MPRKSWSGKDERQYEHVKRTELRRGRSSERAKEIAARTVNKQRRVEGRTADEASSGRGSSSLSLGGRTKQELLDQARERGVKGRSSMTKDELVRALRRSE